MHGGQVGVDARAFEAGEVQVLQGPDKRAGTAPDGIAQGLDVSAGFRRKKDGSLLCLGGHSDFQALVAEGRFPGLGLEKPRRRRRVGDAAHKGDDQEVVHRLRVREVRMNAQTVTSLERGHLRDRQRFACTRDVYFNVGPLEVERGTVSSGSS